MARRRAVRTSLALEPEVLERVKAVALDLGCRTPTGPHTGEGSVSELLRAIASGELVVRRALADAEGNLAALYQASVDALLRMREAGVAVTLPRRETIPSDLVERYDKVMAMGSDALIEREL